MIIGEAVIEIKALTSGMSEQLRAESGTAFGQLESDAQASGRRAGGNLSSGFHEGAQSMTSDAERLGQDAGGALSSGIAGGGAKAEQGLRGVQSEMEATGGKSTVLGGLFQKLGGGMSNMGVLGGEAFTKMGEKMDETSSKGSSFAGTLSSVGKTGALAGAVGLAAFSAEAVNLAIKYQSSTTQLAASAKISTGAAKGIGDAFLNTMGTTIYSGQAIMSAYAPVAAQLGLVQGHALNAAQATKFMGSSMDLAEASGTSLGSATGALTRVVQTYGTGVKGADDASNVLFNTSRLTGQSIDSLAGMFAKLHGRLGEATPPIGQIGGLMAELSTKGVAGRQAISGLSTAINGLIAPSKQQQAMLQMLGVQTTDASGKFVGMHSVVGQLHDAFGRLTPQQQATAASTIFGKQSFQGMLEVVNGGPTQLDKMTHSVDQAGSAHQAAAKQSQTLGHQMELVKATVEDLAVKWGNVLLPVIHRVVGVIADATTWIMHHKEVLIGLGIVVGGALTAAFAALAISVLSATWPILAIAAACAALVTAALYLYNHWTKIWGEIKRVFDEVVKFLRSGFGTLSLLLLGPLAPMAFLALHWQQIWHAMQDVFSTVVHAFTTNPWLSVLTGIIMTGVHFIQAIWNAAWGTIVSYTKMVWSLIWGTIQIGVDIIRGIISFFAALFTGNWTAMWNAIHDTVANVWGAIEGIVMGAVNFVTGIITVGIDLAKTTWDAVWGGFKDTVSNIWDGIKGVVIDGVNFVIGLINGMINAANHVIGFLSFGQVHIPTISPIGGGGPNNSDSGGLLRNAGSFGGAHADGGPVVGGRRYLVGERGPEMFTSGTPGNIVSNAGLSMGMGDTAANTMLATTQRFGQQTVGALQTSWERARANTLSSLQLMGQQQQQNQQLSLGQTLAYGANTVNTLNNAWTITRLQTQASTDLMLQSLMSHHALELAGSQAYGANTVQTFNNAWTITRLQSQANWDLMYQQLAAHNALSLLNVQNTTQQMHDLTLQRQLELNAQLPPLVSSMWSTVADHYRTGIDQSIGDLDKFLGSINTTAGQVGWSVNLNVPALSSGGVFNSPTAIVGEGGHPEVVVPLDPAKRSRAMGLMSYAGAHMMADGGVLGSDPTWTNLATPTGIGGLPPAVVNALAAHAASSLSSHEQAMLASAGGPLGFNAALFGGGGGAISGAQVAGYWIAAGGPPAAAGIMAGISYYESGDQPGIVQQGQPYSTTGWGLWQITPGNSVPQVGVDQALLNPLTNARAAVWKFNAGGGLYPWTGDPMVNSLGGPAAGNALLGLDNGGWLPPGLSHVWNGLGRPEYVPPPGAGGGRGGGGVTLLVAPDAITINPAPGNDANSIAETRRSIELGFDRLATAMRSGVAPLRGAWTG